jgi:hypothetical protein
VCLARGADFASTATTPSPGGHVVLLSPNSSSELGPGDHRACLLEYTFDRTIYVEHNISFQAIFMAMNTFLSFCFFYLSLSNQMQHYSYKKTDSILFKTAHH